MKSKLEYAPDRLKPRASRVIVAWITISSVVTLGALLLLRAFDVPLGQGYFVLRYSPLQQERTISALAILPAALIAGAAVWCLSLPQRKTIGLSLLLLWAVMTAGWIWFAPPAALDQQAFNFRSNSSDGAFVTEAERIDSISRYLRLFDTRLKQSVDELGGTRILSNPPGMTILSRWVITALRSHPDNALEKRLFEQYQVRREDLPIVANSLRVSIAMTGVWLLAVVAAYALGLLFLRPASAAVFAVVLMFNPALAHFAPGKDVAQLLPIVLMLTCWFAGTRFRSVLLSLLAGVLLTIGSVLGLVQFWVAAIALAAAFWQAGSQRDVRGFMTRNLLPFVAGTIATMVIVQLNTGWNMPATLVAVWRRFNELQPTFERNRAVWFVIGLPIFLLFLSPGLWTMLGLSIRRARMNLGMRLLICSIAVMLLTYAMGVTYELPRLWIAFLPTLMLGAATAGPLPRRPRVLAMIVIAQIMFTAFHWTMLDAREAEYRITSRRLYQ